MDLLHPGEDGPHRRRHSRRGRVHLRTPGGVLPARDPFPPHGLRHRDEEDLRDAGRLYGLLGRNVQVIPERQLHVGTHVHDPLPGEGEDLQRVRPCQHGGHDLLAPDAGERHGRHHVQHPGLYGNELRQYEGYADGWKAGKPCRHRFHFRDEDDPREATPCQGDRQPLVRLDWREDHLRQGVQHEQGAPPVRDEHHPHLSRLLRRPLIPGRDAGRH